MPISDWLLYQQALIMLLCWQQICAFHLLFFWYKIAPVFGWQLETFHSSSVMRSLTVWHFSYEYLQEFLGYESLFWKYIDFFAVHGGFLHVTLFIEITQALIFQVFKVHGLCPCVPNFSIRYHLWRILLGFKVGTNFFL